MVLFLVIVMQSEKNPHEGDPRPPSWAGFPYWVAQCEHTAVTVSVTLWNCSCRFGTFSKSRCVHTGTVCCTCRFGTFSQSHDTVCSHCDSVFFPAGLCSLSLSVTCLRWLCLQLQFQASPCSLSLVCLSLCEELKWTEWVTLQWAECDCVFGIIVMYVIYM